MEGSFYTKEEKAEEDEDDIEEENKIKKMWDLLFENLDLKNILIRQLSLKQW